MAESYHRPVMVDEIIALFEPISRGIVIDATFGGGGHSARLRDTMSSDITIIGIDRDPEARANADSLGIRVLAGDFGDLASILDSADIDGVAGVLFDFGVSSHQLDSSSRGFSYRDDGPLDMRMDQTAGRSAADIVNESSRDEIASILSTYGEERFARRIASAIVAHRPITTTTELADIVTTAIPAATRRTGGHPARRTFQALRIAVNQELDSIERGLDAAMDRLDVGGRVVAMSYHSLEDRIVKRRFAAATAGCSCPPDLPVCACGADPRFRLLTRKPLSASPSEVAANPRARSVRVRAVECVRAA